MTQLKATVFSLLAAFIFLSPIITAESAVELDGIIHLSEEDLSIKGIAENPEENQLLIYAEDGYASIISSKNPDSQVLLAPSDNQTMRDADWHPGGGTALMVGDEGMILRYAASDFSLTQAGEKMNFGQTDLNSVAWNTAGSWAYVGGDDGWLWRVRAQADGGLDTHLIEGRGEGDITDIDCHDDVMLCVISSVTDGIGIIDRNHILTWIGGSFYPWTSVICPSNYYMSCVSVSSSQEIGIIQLNSTNGIESELFVSTVKGVEGQFTHLSHQKGTRSLIVVAPFSLLEHDISKNATYPWLNHEDAQKFDIELSGERIIGTWNNGEDGGWIITNRGTIVEFHSTEEGTEIGAIVGIIVGFLIPLTIGMLVLTLIYTASPKIQYSMTMKFGNKQEKRDAKRRRKGKR